MATTEYRRRVLYLYYSYSGTVVHKDILLLLHPVIQIQYEYCGNEVMSFFIYIYIVLCVVQFWNQCVGIEVHLQYTINNSQLL